MTATPSTTVANLRDLGGTPLSGGRTVRSGLVLRSGQLDRLDLDADPAVAALGLRTVIDFRTDIERADHPDRVPDGVRVLVGDVLADKMGAGKVPAAAQLKDLLSDPVVAEEHLGGGKAQTLFGGIYRSFVNSGSAQAAYRMLLTEAADPEAGPLLFHCTAGKDRTGWGATIILSLLGADDETLMAEYLSVNPAVKQAFAPMIEGFTAAGGDPDIALALIGVFPSYLEAALDEVSTRYGSIEKYVREGLGVSDETVEALRARLTV
ncbi:MULTISPECIES: tyrosine-protein phosphatase [unclassified Streptomyces]|uniref:tyrosine-protein phosphatase n=1 Tax=unclassified Streptomyces TaxID=2593676 RepID=UPI001BE9BFD2|nr:MULTISPECIES: tyrosine-protein phosphatase [unclassified Streptomyces]MBT2406931.1 tyrosine-protein phosphatase [Streptomyces sp. ISL-21]MBT2459047.1 tyrosine-protein phosphatase [Streptomyces sp. ISL-86]MBT2612372.1 tyrosine-protein phosphatase [Streptomyces sp. ISL-87]